MAITAADVKVLREKTGAGMLDCQKALKEANGDLAEAETILKKQGLAAVAKRADRAAEEGRIFVHVGNGRAGILELACETDFVARNADFVVTGTSIAKQAVEQNLSATDAGLLAQVTEIAATIKENITLRRLEIFPLGANDFAETYLHGDAANVGVLVIFKLSDLALAKKDAVSSIIHDCALHAAAFKPQFLKGDAISASYLAKQKEIFEALVAQDEKLKDKPENVRLGAVNGKLQKLVKEISFLEQPFVKDDKKSVAQVLADTGKANGGTVEMINFRVYRAGETLEG